MLNSDNDDASLLFKTSIGYSRVLRNALPTPHFLRAAPESVLYIFLSFHKLSFSFQGAKILPTVHLGCTKPMSTEIGSLSDLNIMMLECEDRICLGKRHCVHRTRTVFAKRNPVDARHVVRVLEVMRAPSISAATFRANSQVRETLKT